MKKTYKVVLFASLVGFLGSCQHKQGSTQSGNEASASSQTQSANSQSGPSASNSQNSNGQSVSCQPKITGKAPVALMGGNAWNLLEAYMNQAKQKGLNIDLHSLKVEVYQNGKFKEYKIGLGAMFTGENYGHLFKEMLSNVNAPISNQEIAQAQQLGWDIMCINPNEKPQAITSTTKTEATKKNQKSENKCNNEAVSDVNLGLQFIQNKNYDQATKEFKAAIKSSPSCGDAYADLVSTYILRNDYDLALDTYKQGVSKVKNDGNLYYTGAVAFVKKGQYDYALDALKQALKNGFKEQDAYTSSDLKPLLDNKKKDFCNLLSSYGVTIKQCL